MSKNKKVVLNYSFKTPHKRREVQTPQYRFVFFKQLGYLLNNKYIVTAQKAVQSFKM